MTTLGTNTRRNPQVDFCFDRAEKWREEIEELRRIVLDCPVAEELKWGKPFYTVPNGNVLVIWKFKDHCALGFCKGALLKDAAKILSQIGENTQAARKVKFTSVKQIVALEPVLAAYIHEAIAIEEAGLEVIYKQTADFAVPPELLARFAQAPALKAAFDALTPGRQRGYLLYFSAPKQSKTRESRIEKCRQRIFEGRGVTDPPPRR